MTRRTLLQRIALLREVEHQAAARAVAQAEAARGELALLAERTLRLTQDYAVRIGEAEGGALADRLRFGGALRAIHDTSRTDLDHADSVTAAKLATLAQAGRRRDMVRERIDAAARDDRRGHRLEDDARTSVAKRDHSAAETGEDKTGVVGMVLDRRAG